MNYKRKNQGHRLLSIVQVKSNPNAIPPFTIVLQKSREFLALCNILKTLCSHHFKSPKSEIKCVLTFSL